MRSCKHCGQILRTTPTKSPEGDNALLFTHVDPPTRESQGPNWTGFKLACRWYVQIEDTVEVESEP